jgi:hypothetical protein
LNGHDSSRQGLTVCGYQQTPTQRKLNGNSSTRLNNNWWQSFSTETVSLKHAVVRNNPKFFYAGLGDEHPIERVPVHGRKTASCYSMPEPDRQRSETVSDDRLFQIIQFNLKTSQRYLNRCLPDGCRTYMHVVVGIGNDFTSRLS